jgi:hypothetical protein
MLWQNHIHLNTWSMWLKIEVKNVYVFIHSNIIILIEKKKEWRLTHSFGSDGPPPIRPESVESAVTRLSHQGNSHCCQVAYFRLLNSKTKLLHNASLCNNRQPL